jgi:hypothetical protein
MKTVIVFCEGHSGRFLQSVILNHPVEIASFRIFPGFVDFFLILFFTVNYQEHQNHPPKIILVICAES